MSKVDEIIIEVEVNAGESAQKLAEVKNKMADLKAEQKALNATIKENGTVTAEQAQRLAQISGELKTLGQEEKMYTAQLNTATGGNKEFGKSLASLGAELTKMKAEYRNMSKEMRESDAGKELQKSIKELDKTMKDADATLGDHQRYVGDCRGALKDAGLDIKNISALFSGGFKNGITQAGTALKSFGKTILATPIGWITAAIAAAVKIFDKLREAFQKNDEAGTALKTAMASLQPVVTAISKLFDGLAVVIAKVATGISNVVAFIGDRLIPAFKEEREAAQELVIEMDNLEEAERQYTVESAKRANERAKLEDEARNNEKLSTEERISNMEKALALEEEDLKERRDIAKRKYEAYKEWAEEQVNASDEVANKLAELEAAYYATETDFYQGTRKLKSQLKSFQTELDNETKQAAANQKAHAEQVRRAWEAARKEREAALGIEKEEMRKLEDLQYGFIEDMYTRTTLTIRANYSRQIEDLQKRLDTEKNLTTQAREYINQQIVLLNEQMWRELAANDESALKENANNIVKMSADAADRAKKAAEEAEKATADERARIRAEYERDALEIANEYQSKLNAIYGNATEQAELEAERTATFYKSLVGMDAETKAAMFESEEQYKAAVLAAEKEMYEARTKSENALKQQAEEIGATMQSVTGALSDLYEAAAGDSEAYEKFKKAMAIVDATISLATTIAAATAVSTEGDPYTMAIRIAANVAAVTAQFAAVIAAIKKATVPSAPAFAKGGIVPGTSYTGDRVTAAVNSREMVLTLQQQGHLFDMIQAGVPQGCIDYRRMAEAVAEGVAALPAPVLDYAEFTSFGRRVALQDRKLTQM